MHKQVQSGSSLMLNFSTRDETLRQIKINAEAERRREILLQRDFITVLCASPSSLAFLIGFW